MFDANYDFLVEITPFASYYCFVISLYFMLFFVFDLHCIPKVKKGHWPGIYLFVTLEEQ